MLKQLALLSVFLFFTSQLTLANTKPVDPIKFTLKTNATRINIGEEMEITITAELLNFPTNTVFIFKDSYAFRLKLVVPEGFKQTGGDYSDFVGTTLSAKKPTVSYKLKGKFVDESSDHQFILLRGNEQSTASSQFVYTTSISYNVEHPDQAAGKSDNAARTMVVATNGFVPYLSMEDLRAGVADSAQVVMVMRGNRAWPYKYDAASTAADDSATVIRHGNLRYLIQTDEIVPEIFGAIGDGSADDSLAFAKAIKYINSKGGGTLTIPGKVYNRGFIKITQKDVHVTGKGTLKNATIYVTGPSAGSIFNFKIDGISIVRTSIASSENSDANNGIELQNVGMGRISNVYFKNNNCDIYVRPTGTFQQTKRIDVISCRSEYGNYGIKIAETPDALITDTTKSKRSVGDFSIDGFKIQWKNYDHIYGFGVDGLSIHDVFCFSSPFDNANRTTKRCNINLIGATKVTMSDLHLFEAGEDAIRLTNCDQVTGNGIIIDWPGQRVASSGIHCIRTTNPEDVEVGISFANTIIETPSLHGIYIEGAYPTQMYSFTGMQFKKIGRADRYYGGSAPYNNPALGTYPHNTIYADANTSGVSYDGSFDSEWITRGANLLGKASYSNELNTRRGTFKRTLSSDTVYDTDEPVTQPGVVENILPRSNSLNSNSFFSWTNATITKIDSTDSPFGKGTIFKLTESSSGNTQKSISTNTTMSKPAVALPYTVSFYAKAAELRFLCLYVTNNSFNNGIKIDYDVLTGGTGAIQRTDTTYKLLRSSIKEADNGFYRIEFSYLAPASTTTVRFAVYLKDKIENPGNQSYAGNGSNGLYLSDFQLSQTAIALPYIRTTANSYAKSTLDLTTVVPKLTGSSTFNPPSIATGGLTSTTINVAGAVMGQSVKPSFSLDVTDSIDLYGRVSSAGVVTVVFKNNGASAVDLASGTLTVKLD